MRGIVAILLLLFSAQLRIAAESTLRFSKIQSLTNREIALELTAPPGAKYRLEVSESGNPWRILSTLSAAENKPLDSGTPYLNSRLYRAAIVEDPATITGDHVPTTEGDLVIHPVNHASFLITWSGIVIYNDPVGGATPYASFPKPDLMLISHEHGDHFNAATLTALRKTGFRLIGPQRVVNQLETSMRLASTVLTNGASTNVFGLTVEAVPAYNSNHARGNGNGYILTLGGKRIYISGDTGDTPEMRAMTQIDVAFLCMNIPYTMTITQAAAASRQFQPKLIYPYHFRNQDNSFADLNQFKRLIGIDLGIEVRVRKWY